jgi:hypothetical protein
MLFKGYPGSDLIKVIWIIPARELWEQYGEGKMMENNTVSESLFNFQHHKDLLEKPEPDDLTDEQINTVYREISLDARRTKAKEKSPL